MTRSDQARLHDVQSAATTIAEHMTRGDLTDGLVFDAVRMRLVEIGEAVGALPVDLLAFEPRIAWREIIGMRNWLAHVYFDSAFDVARATIVHDLPPLLAACDRLLERLDERA